MVEAVLERLAGDADTEFRDVGEVRQPLLTRWMLLAKDHLLLRAMQRLPSPHPALERATDAAGEAWVPTLQLAQNGHRTELRGGLQHRQDLAVPDRGQRIGSTTRARLSLLRWWPWVGIEPGAGARAHAAFGGRDLTTVASAEVHVQSRLLICDVCAGHGVLFREVEKPPHPARRHGVAGSPTRGCPPGSAYGRATPVLRPTPAHLIQIDALEPS